MRVIKNGVLLPTPFIDVSAKVNTFDDRGFWGFTFDPDFANNGYVYMTYVYENTGNPNDTGVKTSRLTRATADPANPDVALAGSEVTILGSVGTAPCSAQPAGADCIPADGSSHTIGNLQFAPDGTLLMGNGDGDDASFADPRALRAQDLTSYSGKILRINKDGTAPSDNPFYDGTNDIKSKVWMYGLRNPYRFSIQPTTGNIWLGDVGWNTWEEINYGAKGANFGWPCYEGAGVQSAYSTQGVCTTLSASAVTAPYYTYNHNVGTAAIGGPFYNATAYPDDYRGNFFFADYTGHYIKRVAFDANNQPTGVQTFATDVDSPVSMAVGPDGMIYYVSFNSGLVNRIRYNGPAAVASSTPKYGYSPLAVSFSSAGTVNPGGGNLTYLWDFGDGTTSAAANPTHTYTSSTVQTIVAKLTVTNQANQSSSATTKVVIGSTPPVPTISAPANNTIVTPGQTINFSGSATDPDDGPLPPSALSWTVLLHHNTHVHTFVGGTGSSGSFVVENHGPIGTFSYEIILTATDSSGLSTSTSVNLPTNSPDTTPPTAPGGLTASASALNVNLSWTAATDNVGVTGYQVERCQGAGCSNFASVSLVAGTTFVDSSLNPSTSYSYRVAAVDGAGNVSPYSNIATATTGSAPVGPAGLVAGYSFDAGSGTTVADVSGNGNTATITGATWATGKYGGGLSFNGTSNIVRVPSSASLNLSSGMTLAAWINPSASQSGWRTIMQKEADAYFLNASNSDTSLRPSGGGTIGTGTPWVGGPTASPVAAWTHVALTYDGAILRLYVNGAEVANKAASGTIQNTANPLWIGGNSPYGEYFNGILDEVRVYNRALSAAEVQAVMNNPVTPPVADTTPPTAPSSATATPTANGQISLAWTASTDNVGVSNYQVERCQGLGCSNFVQVATAAGSPFNDSGLSPQTSYSYRVRAVDQAGNLSGYSNISSATTTASPDTTPPTAPAGLVATAMTTSQIDLTWTASTDDVGVTQYLVERCSGASCTTFAQVGTSTTTSFSSTGLTANTAYRFRVRATDAAGNLSAYSSIASATTKATDTTKPSAPTGLTPTVVGPTQVNLTWTASTDNVGVTGYRVERCTGASCTNYAQIATPTATSFSDINLTPSTVYRYRVRATDAAGNLSSYSSVVSATTTAVPDNSPPTAPTGLSAAASGLTVSLSWTASTDNVGVTGYRIERCQGTGCSGFAQVATASGTSYVDASLTASTSYSYRVAAVDAAGNVSGYSGVASATTGTAPVGPAGLVAGYTFDEGSGTTVTDLSGNGNTGTITGATWTTGKYGGGLSFNGTSNIIRVPSAASLNLSAGMTLAAWINPAATQNGWRTIMQKETDAFFLNASNSDTSLRPAGGGTIGTSQPWVGGPTASPVGAWTHVALTYDGTTLILYVNGVQVATKAASGNVQTTANPLWIGGNSPYGEYFNGILDEVRVYNRALSAAEIGTVMNNPLAQSVSLTSFRIPGRGPGSAQASSDKAWIYVPIALLMIGVLSAAGFMFHRKNRSRRQRTAPAGAPPLR